jgi:hypothetical protein
MAQGIQDIGNGIGYLYKTLPNGTTIVASERNTVDGARSMREQGTANAPVVAQRPAVGTITVTASGADTITAITIAAVNQILLPIAVVSAVPSVVAGQIASAINSFTPGSGFNYTAQAVNDVVYVFSPVANGAAANGLAITVSVTVGNVTTTTTALTNGSSDAGTYDSALGYRFYINADYSGPATPTSLVNAVEVTEYMTVRGLQTGIVTINSTVATDRLVGLNRSCAITQIIVDTESSAATDILAFIETTGFAEGDEIRLRNTTPSRVTTVEDAAVTTSPILTKNIYLVDRAPFSLTGRLSINLQLRNDPVIGGFVWVETGRSEVANGVIDVTIAQLNALCGPRQLKPNALYNVTDLGDYGTVVTAISPAEISPQGRMTRRVPKNYVACWQPTLAAVAINSRYRYYNRVYRNTTGAVSVGTDPATDTTNWTLEAITSNTYYGSDVHNVTVNQDAGLGIITTWPILSESDNNNNVLSQTEAYFNASGINGYEFFQWQLPIGTPTVYNNTVTDSIFEVGNFNCPVYNCTLTNGSQFILNTTPVTAVQVAGLTAVGVQITSNPIWEVLNVNAESCTFNANTDLYLRDSNFTNTTLSGNTFCDILDCSITDSNIANNINLCQIWEIQGKYNITGNDSTFISNVTGFNDVGGFNQINNNVNTTISDVTGSLFFINANENIIIQYNIVMYNGYIRNNINTVPANKANCRIEQVSLRNEAKIEFNTWNTTGNIVRGSLSGFFGSIANLLIDTTVSIAVGTVEGVARTAQQVVAGPGAILDQFTLDNVGINGNSLTRSLHILIPNLAALSVPGNITGISCTPSSNNAFAFIDAATAIAAGVLTIPLYAAHAANLYFYNCNGQSITSIVYTGTTYSANYTGGLRLIRMSGAGTLIVTPTAVGVAAVNQIVADTAGPYTLAAIYDVVEVKKQASFYTLLNSAIVI